MKNWICCDMSYAHCRVCELKSHFRANEEVKAAMATETIIHQAKSDNTNLFRNFVQSIDEIPLTCDVHGSGTYHVCCMLHSWFRLVLMSPPQRFHVIQACTSSTSPRARSCTRSTTHLCCAAHQSGTFCTSPSCGEDFSLPTHKGQQQMCKLVDELLAGPVVLADYCYANCMHQNSQEGT
jgi:hypothetical protein